jgi:hypothetical protein
MVKWIMLLIAGALLASCDGKTYDDDAPLGYGVKINVYRLEPAPVDLSKYSILDLSETVSEPTNFVPPSSMTQPSPLLQVEERPVNDFGSKVLNILGMGDKPVQHDSEYERGRQFAKSREVMDTNYCRGSSISFVDGCVDYMLSVQ